MEEFEEVLVEGVRRGDEIKLGPSARTTYFVESIIAGQCVARPLNDELPEPDHLIGASTTILDLSLLISVHRRMPVGHRSRGHSVRKRTAIRSAPGDGSLTRGESRICPTFCTELNCTQPANIRGVQSSQWLCNAHARKESHEYEGESEVPIRHRACSGEPMRWLQEHAFAEYDPEMCLEWPFPLTSGYGQLYDPKRKRAIRVQRFVLEMVEDPPSTEHWAMHTCGMKHCVNPAHLRWVHESESGDFLKDPTNEEFDNLGDW